MVFSFNDSKFSASWTGFTLEWYRRLLERDDILDGLRRSLLVGTVASAPVAAAGPSVALAVEDTTGGSWIVQLVPGASSAGESLGMARAAGGRVGQVYRHALNGFQFVGSAAGAAALLRNPRVSSVTPDHAVQLVESLPHGVERVEAYDNDTPANDAYHQGYRGNGARIAILDTGIDLDHPDLAASIDQGLGKNCVTPGAPPEKPQLATEPSGFFTST